MIVRAHQVRVTEIQAIRAMRAIPSNTFSKWKFLLETTNEEQKSMSCGKVRFFIFYSFLCATSHTLTHSTIKCRCRGVRHRLEIASPIPDQIAAVINPFEIDTD